MTGRPGHFAIPNLDIQYQLLSIVSRWLAVGIVGRRNARRCAVDRGADRAAQCDRSGGDSSANDCEDQGVFCCRSAGLVLREVAKKFDHINYPYSS